MSSEHIDPEFIYRWCKKYGLHEETAEVLQEEMICSPHALVGLSNKALNRLPLPLGQKCLLRGALLQYQESDASNPNNGLLRRNGKQGSMVSLQSNASSRIDPKLTSRIENDPAFQSRLQMILKTRGKLPNRTGQDSMAAIVEKVVEHKRAREQPWPRNTNHSPKPPVHLEPLQDEPEEQENEPTVEDSAQREIEEMESQLDNDLDELVSGRIKYDDGKDPMQVARDILNNGLFTKEELALVEEHKRQNTGKKK